MIELIRRVWYLLNRSRLERELQAEMEEHRRQMGEASTFGSPLRWREESRDIWGWRWLDVLAQDLKYAVRGAKRSPGYSLACFFVLSVTVGINLTLFQFVNVFLLQPPPLRDADTLVRFQRTGKNFSSSSVPYTTAEALSRETEGLLSAMILQADASLVWDHDTEQQVRSMFVSSNLFDELGHGPALGRVLRARIDDRPDAAPVVVVSHAFWKSRLNGDNSVIGRSVTVNGRPVTIAGVANSLFNGFARAERPADLWLPLDKIDYILPGSQFKTSSENNTKAYGRLAPGVTLQHARDKLAAALAALRAARPEQIVEGEVWEPLPSSRQFVSTREWREIWTFILVIGALTMTVLAVACANIANLALSRAQRKAREFSLRAAIGAGRQRLVRQVLTDSLLTALTGIVGGLWLAYATARALGSVTGIPSAIDFTPDWRTASAAAALLTFVVILSGVGPAFKATRLDPAAALKDGGYAVAGGRSRWQKCLVSAQVAGSCTLVFVAALLLRQIDTTLRSHPGFEFDRMAVAEPRLNALGFKADDARLFWDRVKARVGAHPNVEGVALTSIAPTGRTVATTTYNDAPGLEVNPSEVEPEFFELMGIRFLAGRNFVASDAPHSTVILSRTTAERMYGSTNVVGSDFPKSEPTQTVIGVVSDARLFQIATAGVGQQYSPLAPSTLAGAVLLVKARRQPGEVLPVARAIARDADARVLARTWLMRDALDEKLRPIRLSGVIASVLSGLTLLLACVGAAALISNWVAARTREIGIRIALGASTVAVMRKVLVGISWPVGVGAIVGSAGAAAVAMMLTGHPFYIDASGWRAPAGGLAMLLVSIALAALAPARRALSIQPTQALRHD